MDQTLNRGGQSQGRRLARLPSFLLKADQSPGFLLELPNHRDGWLVARRVRVIRRLIAVIVWTLPCMAVQAVFLLLNRESKVRFPRLYWAIFTRLLGLRVQVVGQAATGQGRPVLFVSNHSSWVDIPVLGGVVKACFVAKGDVAGWPVIGSISRLGRTVFVSRSRVTTGRERDDMRARLKAGDSLILFPEGTSSDGSRVLPFRSSFFSVAEVRSGEATQDLPLIQPVSVVYDRLSGLPAGRATRPIFAWYGDMDIASHFWRLGQYTGLRATVLLHPPMEPSDFAGRKQMSDGIWRVVADGASTLRQNRPPLPREPAASPAPDSGLVLA